MVLRKLTKEEAKEEVKKLVDKYNRIVESGSIKRYKEEDTKAEFIEPLFEALGWDVRNTENDDEVVREEKISKGRVDYSFRINGIPKFFLEAKALKEDLDNIKFVEQAVNYSWHKSCTWAVLTDFEAIKIFNAEWKSANPLQAQFGQTLPCQLFLEKFDTLWLLSRESFEKKLLDIEAEKWGKKIKKTSVDKQLLSDLTRFRDLLNKNILKNNASKNISGDELDEAVQRIIDRLIFIRTLEDKELEAPMLQSVIREDLNKRIYKKLNPIFRKIDDIYNSKLFTPHLCEDLDIDDEVLSKIIGGLFATTDNTVRYDFSAIDADVLGNIYEQYLGHILKKTDKRAKLAEGKAHRKEQGIYYTPTHIVDYIVKNTVGELLKDKKIDPAKIKILDPACGSGSFLIKAFDYLNERLSKGEETKQRRLDSQGMYSVKTDILNWAQQNNIDYSKVVVAKAEIRLPYENPTDFTRLNYYPSQLFLATRETSDKDHLVLYEPVKDLSVYETNGTINRSLLYYSLDVSSYVQRMMQGKITGSTLQTWVTPVMQTSDFYSGVTTFYVQNLLYGKAILNGPAAARKPKLILTYAVMP